MNVIAGLHIFFWEFITYKYSILEIRKLAYNKSVEILVRVLYGSYMYIYTEVSLKKQGKYPLLLC